MLGFPSRKALSAVLWAASCLIFCADSGSVAAAGDASRLSVADYLPAGFVRDGSVSYQAEVQRAIDDAAKTGQTLVFPAMTFAVDENGWRLSSGSRLQLTGAKFAVAENATQDGAVFHGRDVTGIKLTGGEIVGRNDRWADGVNIRGVHITGRSADIRISEMTIRDLTSNGIGLFGDEEHYIRDVWVRDVVVDHCCNRYPDYLSGEKWEQGSEREDQGLVAFYYVEDFVVAGSRFERSRSDGTHFYKSRRGHITDNRIYRAKMGGYFLEGFTEVIGRGNTMLENGSRGTTIERGSVNCLFSDNVVSRSGREGLWAPDCVGLVVTGNVFSRNGRKPNGKEPHQIWNANITINEARHDPSESPTRDYLISDNIIVTTASQVAAIRVDTTASTQAIVIRDNLLRGERTDIAVSGANPAGVVVAENVENETAAPVPAEP